MNSQKGKSRTNEDDWLDETNNLDSSESERNASRVRKTPAKQTKKRKTTNSQKGKSRRNEDDWLDETNNLDSSESEGSVSRVRQTRAKQTKKTKATNSQKGKDDWSEEQLDNFLETLRTQPIKELTDTRNRWVLFAKRLQNKGTDKNNDECKAQVMR